jgi:hypothetical protein
MIFLPKNVNMVYWPRGFGKCCPRDQTMSFNTIDQFVRLKTGTDGHTLITVTSAINIDPVAFGQHAA